eukprot:408270_1
MKHYSSLSLSSNLITPNITGHTNTNSFFSDDIMDTLPEEQQHYQQILQQSSQQIQISVPPIETQIYETQTQQSSHQHTGAAINIQKELYYTNHKKNHRLNIAQNNLICSKLLDAQALMDSNLSTLTG